MNTLNIFMLGRPGGGKSEVYRRFVKRFQKVGIARKTPPRLDDFPKLWAIFQEDEKTGEWKRCRKTPDGGYKVTDNGVWDDILTALNSDIEKLQGRESVVFAEFSRPNYVHSMRRNFSEMVRQNSLIVYIACSFDTCWKRNVRRHEAAVAKGTDDHLVSREEMEKTYLRDDQARLNDAGIPVFTIDNEPEGDKHLDPQIDKIFSEIMEHIKKWKEGR